MTRLARALGLTSLRRMLLLGIGVPMLVFLLINAVTLYRQALQAADTAYDRTLLASAKAIGELLSVTASNGQPQLTASLTYAALEAFEADNRSQIYYKVSGFEGEMVAGFENLRTWRGELPARNVYAALVHFYDDQFESRPVRVAVLLQPVASDVGQGMATIQVAETLELRHELARELLVKTVWQHGLLLAVVAAVLGLVVHSATERVKRLSLQLHERAENDLSPLSHALAPQELRPMVHATNDLMARLARLLEHQKRFVRDTSHQLRTPLAVLQAQVQSALRGDVDPRQALREIGHTVNGATALANQMLALAKVEQLRQEGPSPPVDWAPIVRQVALDLAPLIADKALDFDLQLQPAPVHANAWALRELARNLLHNAIRHSPRGAPLLARLQTAPDAKANADPGATQHRMATLLVRDAGPGLDPSVRDRLFQPFVQGQGADSAGSTGLGLAICAEIAHSVGGRISLEDRIESGRPAGLDALAQLPLSQSLLTHSSPAFFSVTGQPTTHSPVEPYDAAIKEPTRGPA